MKSDQKETEKLEGISKNSSMSGMNMMMGMMLACFVAAIIFSSIAGDRLIWWWDRSNPQPVNSPSNSSQPLK